MPFGGKVGMRTLIVRSKSKKAMTKELELGDQVGGDWPTAAIPMDNPCCSCKLLRSGHREGS